MGNDKNNSQKIILEPNSKSEKFETLKNLIRENFNKNPDKAKIFKNKAIEFLKENPDKNKEVELIELESDLYLKQRNYFKTIELAKKGLILSEVLDDEISKASFNSIIAKANLSSGRFDIALEMFRQSSEIYNKYHDKKNQAEMLNEIGRSYRKLSNYSTALEYFIQSMKIYQEINDPPGVALNLNHIGIINIIFENFQKGKECFENSLEIWKKLNDLKGIADAYNNLGLAYMHMEKYQKSMNYYQQSLNIKQKISDNRGIANTLNNMGNIHNELKNYDQALHCYQQALDIKKDNSDNRGMASTLSNMGLLYLKIKKTDLAIQFANESLNISEKIQDNKLISINYELLYKIYKSIDDFSQSLKYLKLFSKFNDQIYSEETEKSITEKQIIFKIEQQEKDKEIYKLKNIELTNSNQKLEQALKKVKKLTGFIPICPKCKKIRDDQGFWEEVETYLYLHSDTQFTHGLCPDCMQKYFPELDQYSNSLTRNSDGK